MPKPYLVRRGLETILAELAVGDSVPAERELAERFSVSRETVRQALHELLVQGRIARQGRGTVVSSPKLIQPLSRGSYTEGAQRQGRVPGRVALAMGDVTGSDDICEDLEIARGSTVLRIDRLLLADGQKLGLESTFLPLPRFDSFHSTFNPETSLYTAMRALGIEFGPAEERIETALGSPREAKLLETTTAMPMLLMNRRSLDSDGVPIERVRSLYRGDRMAFEVVLRE
ncbi:GntR family transcriptional regulator [Gordonia jinhuaensis]|uniref:GntR-family transcriptional regulator n=1 Tax=Gordonia jinhuaensis TaxID=1517702 RepID=A0A916T3Y3_9ACTN|nr:GntR family transcriptional regulator [Gordonia jinhuaensis]GGB29516.1 putative GntR-family transcriptional regulator [Gordonia jinhuaensis]